MLSSRAASSSTRPRRPYPSPRPALTYSSNYLVSRRHPSDSIQFEFRLTPSFRSKPAFSSPTIAVATHRPPPTDGSDIDHADPAFLVFPSPPPSSASPSPQCTSTSIVHNGDTAAAAAAAATATATAATTIASPLLLPAHKLILNKFCLFRPQYMLLTLDPLRRQGEPLDAQDLAAAWAVLARTPEPGGYVVYNGGREAGSSRKHKHLQVLGMPGSGEGGREADARALWPRDMARLPFVYFWHDVDEARGRTGDEDEVLRGLVRAAEEHAAACRVALRVAEGDAFDHNVILTRDRMVTIPRRRGTVPAIKGHNVGAQGMLGLVWVNEEAQMDAWKATGMAAVLRDLGVSR